MSNSSLVDYVKISPNSSNPRNKKIKKITLHHVAGNLTVEQIGNIFASASRRASSNYGIDSNGRVGMYVEEKNRAWTSGSADNDHQAITIEVANSKSGNPWPVSDKALNKLIELCVDICRRNGIDRLNYTGDASGNFTRHNMFQATACPGPYLISKMPYIADEVNRRLSDTSSGLYRVQTADRRLRRQGKRRGLPSLKVGSKVRVKKGAKDYNGVQLASFVYGRTYDVIQVSGDRVVIGEGKAVTAAVRLKDLTLV